MDDAVDELHGYIKVNQRVISASINRGITVTTFPCLPSCDLGNLTTHDTYWSLENANELRDWLASLEEGVIAIGVSGDDASVKLDPAKAIFTSMGMDITGFGHRWRLAFITQVGSPHLSKVLAEPPGEPAILTAEICTYFLFFGNSISFNDYMLLLLLFTHVISQYY